MVYMSSNISFLAKLYCQCHKSQDRHHERRDAKKIKIIFFMLKVKTFFVRNPHDDMLAVSKV